jgi:hypothetical protein
MPKKCRAFADRHPEGKEHLRALDSTELLELIVEHIERRMKRSGLAGK